jgi:hypothetical protein
MTPPDKTEPIKPGAKLDPKASEMVKKIKALAQKAQAEFGAQHVGRIRFMPKSRPPGNHCSCACSCC